MVSKSRKLAALLTGAVAGAAAYLAIRNMRRNPSPYSYRGSSFEIPRPFLTRDELREILEPRPGERILEVGPGKGYYSLAVAAWISPGGSLDILDLQTEMLEYTARKARSEVIENIVATRADASVLPYADDVFDGAYLVAVLGEVPEKERAMRELWRVVKPGGRVVFGEAITDPHRIPAKRLRDLAENAGFRFERTEGGLLGRFYRFGG